MRRSGARHLVALAACGLAVALPSASDACSYLPDVGVFAEPLFQDPTFVIDTTRVDLACVASGDGADCTAEIRHTVRTTTGRAGTSRVAVLTDPHRPPEAIEVSTVAGLVPVTAELVPTDTAWAWGDEDAGLQGTYKMAAHTFDLTIGAESSLELVVRSRLHVRRTTAPCTNDGVRERHPFLSAGRRTFEHLFMFWANQGKTRSARTLKLHVRRPVGWETRVGQGFEERRLGPSATDLLEAVDEGTVTFGADDPPVDLELVIPGAPVLHGGPVAGVDLAFGSEGGLRGFLAYEIAAPRWLAESLAVEADVNGRVAIVPAAEALTRSHSSSPVTGVGLGVPIRVTPEVRVGGRAEASATLRWWLGLRVGVDVYPPMAGRPSAVDGFVGLRASF